jgi:hypothetical protein
MSGACCARQLRPTHRACSNIAGTVAGPSISVDGRGQSSELWCYHELTAVLSGSSSAVERQLPKLDVAGSIPVSRSIPLLAGVAAEGPVPKGVRHLDQKLSLQNLLHRVPNSGSDTAPSSAISSCVSFTATAPMFSSKCETDDVPAIGNMIRERCSSQASATCIGVT